MLQHFAYHFSLGYPPHHQEGPVFSSQSQVLLTSSVFSVTFRSSCGQPTRRKMRILKGRLCDPPMGQCCSQSANQMSSFPLQHIGAEQWGCCYHAAPVETCWAPLQCQTSAITCDTGLRSRVLGYDPQQTSPWASRPSRSCNHQLQHFTFTVLVKEFRVTVHTSSTFRNNRMWNKIYKEKQWNVYTKWLSGLERGFSG